MLAEIGRPIYALGECEIDLARRELRILGAPVPVGARSFEVMEVLAQSAGELVTKDQLMHRIWPGAIVSDNTLQVHAAAIRKALGRHRGLLKTESRRGYRLLGTWTTRLRNAAPPVGLQQIRTDDETQRSNLPLSNSRPVGRSTALQRVQDLVSAYRVVTLTGPGGIGKTTLALNVAGQVHQEYRDGRWLIELASLSDPQLVPSTVAGVLGLKIGGEVSAESVARTVGGANLLLVLDNCEHLIDAVADFVETLVSLCPRTAILATSREVLQINGEYVYRVPPLEVPAADQDEPSSILGCSAVELFVSRARASGADFSAQTDMLSAIGDICRHLDGIPLAIEFAAARAAVLGVQQVTANLHDRFSLLTRGRRTALPRHRTLRAALDWSYDLLSDPERILLRRLAVFPAGFTLEAAVAVMTHADDVAPVTDCIANLVAKSLVMLDRSETGTRWYLLETTRAYAHEKLEASGESPEIELRRAKFCLELFAPFGSEAQLRAAVDSLSRYRLEVDNLRAALEWCFGPAGNLEVGVRLAAAATPFFLALSLLPECHRWSARALRALDDRNGGGAAEMHLQAGLGISSMYTEGHSDQSKAALSRGLLLAEHLQDLINQFRIIGQLHSFHRRAGNFDQMLAVARQSEAVATRMGDPVLIAGAHSLLGVSHHLIGNQSEARAHLQKALAPATEASLAKARIFGFHRERPRIVLARTLWLLGYPDQARQLARETIDALGSAEPVTICIVLIWGACVFRWIGDLTSATQSIDRLLLHADLHALAPYKAVGHSLQGQLLIQRGDANAGVELLRSSLGTLSAERYELYGTELNSSLAQGLALIGQLDQALHTIDRMIAQLQQHGELFLPELQRIRGRILEQAADEQAAEQAFHQSIDQAEQQSARSWHLRTSMDLARLQFRQGRREEARKTLADSLDCFNEGFETADLRAAQRLLPTLS